jgi:two-component system cell cycle response regulator DivK
MLSSELPESVIGTKRTSSYALDGEAKIAKAAGCDDYVPKPYSPRELLAKIRQYLF